MVPPSSIPIKKSVLIRFFFFIVALVYIDKDIREPIIYGLIYRLPPTFILLILPEKGFFSCKCVHLLSNGVEVPFIDEFAGNVPFHASV